MLSPVKGSLAFFVLVVALLPSPPSQVPSLLHLLALLVGFVTGIAWSNWDCPACPCLGGLANCLGWLLLIPRIPKDSDCIME